VALAVIRNPIHRREAVMPIQFVSGDLFANRFKAHWVPPKGFELFPATPLLSQAYNLRIPPVMGQAWYHFRMRKILQNPVYKTGLPVWNKEPQGRFHEMVDGR
jgi:hypothetical protein